MNYYLVPRSIAESLQLTQIRKSSPGGFYLLSEYDIQPYGIERAINEGAVELKEKQTPVPTSGAEQDTELLEQPDSGNTGGSPEGEGPETVENTGGEPEGNTAGEEGADETQDDEEENEEEEEQS